MLSQIRNNRQKCHTMILDEISDYLFRKKRYELDFALTLAISDSNESTGDFSNHIRQTDKYIVLDKGSLGCIVFDGVSTDNAIKAATNLQTIFENRNFGKSHFISMVSSSDFGNEDAYKMINSLFDLLEYAISNNNSHKVIDLSYLEFNL